MTTKKKRNTATLTPPNETSGAQSNDRKPDAPEVRHRVDRSPQNPPETGGRDPSTGRFLPGNSGNGGGRPKLPEWFKAGGEVALRYLLDVATGAESVEKQELRMRAAERVAELVYGRPTVADGMSDEMPPALAGLLALARRVNAQRDTALQQENHE